MFTVKSIWCFVIVVFLTQFLHFHSVVYKLAFLEKIGLDLTNDADVVIVRI